MTPLPRIEPRRTRLTPMARALLLSACLHGAAIALIQPSPATERPRLLVISARLQPPPAAPAPTPTPAAFATAQPEAADVASGQPAPPPLEMNGQPALTLPSAAAVQPLPAPAPAPAPVPATVPDTGSTAPTEIAPPPRAGPPAASPLPSLPLGIDDTWYLARQVDTHPRAIGRIEPAYPEEARRSNLEGTLKIRVRIDELGRVVEAEVVEAQPPKVFDRATLEAFRAARFQPALRDGRPVRYEAYIRVDFKLEN